MVSEGKLSSALASSSTNTTAQVTYLSTGRRHLIPDVD